MEIDSCANQSVVGILENEKVPYEFIYPYICHNIHELLSHQTGGAQQHINKQNIEQLVISLPKHDVICKYKKMVNPIYSKITNNCFENEQLAQLRDALLQKLMSGEIDVSNVEIDKVSTNKLSFSIMIIEYFYIKIVIIIGVVNYKNNTFKWSNNPV